MPETPNEWLEFPKPLSSRAILEAQNAAMSLATTSPLEKIDLEALPFHEAVARAYAELGDDCIAIYEPGPTLLKGVAEIWGMGRFFGPHITVNAQCLEASERMSIADVWLDVGSHFWSVMENEVGAEGPQK
ncbi:MAG: hypothetical protein F4Y04_00260 [Chloroflexi bacterium]|nr:hypothetical protein [Chloroflexota bacterium]